VAPSIEGTTAGQTVSYQKTFSPFAQVTISDPNSGTTDAVTIAVTGGGTLADGTGFKGLSQTSTGHYSMTAASAAAATAELDSLVYTPAPGLTAAANVSFNIVDTTSANTSASDNKTTVQVTIDPQPHVGQVTVYLPVGAGINLSSAILAAASPGAARDTLSIVADDTSNTLGSATLVGGQLSYAATGPALSSIAANSTVPDGLGYTISDQYGDSANGEVPITVTNTTNINGSAYGYCIIEGTTGTDTINAFGYYNTIYANGGNDVVNAGAGNATVYTGSGNVTTTLANSQNLVSGGNGSNQVSGGPQGLNTVTLGNGNNTISVGGYSNVITVGSGTNMITAGSGKETVTAGAGNDTIVLSGFGNSVTLNGSTAHVSGGQGSDTFVINGGTDQLALGGPGETVRLNGAGSFSINDLGSGLTAYVGSATQTDKITGFASSDTSAIIDLINGVGAYASVGSVLSALQSDGHGGTTLALGTTGSIDFLGTTQSQLHASNFKIG
jgi:Ca2+-binding RTX toxin-like protein